MNKKNEDLFDFLTAIGKEARKEFYKTQSVFCVAHIEKKSINCLDKNESINRFIQELPASTFNQIEKRDDFYRKYAEYCNYIGHKEYGKKIFFDEIRKTGKFDERRISGEWCFISRFNENVFINPTKADSE